MAKRNTNPFVLKQVGPNGEAYGDFMWPLRVGAVVKCEKWDPKLECGNGLHGWLKGEGNGGLASSVVDSKWLVVRPIGEIVNLNGKVKFPKCRIFFVGTRDQATAWIKEKHPEATVIYSNVTAGDNGTATAAGHGGTATAGYGGTATAGNFGTATAGNFGTATAGNYGTATAGYGGTATAGDRGTATAGFGGTATAGSGGTATAGDGGTATAGHGGQLRIAYYNTRYRLAVAYVGENGILPNVKYRVTETGVFFKA